MPSEAALIARLVAELGEGAVVSGDAALRDPRVLEHVSGLEVGRPLAWIAPGTTEACRAAAATCAEAGVRLVPIGDALTFWDPVRLGGAVLLDTRSLRHPLVIEPDGRWALAGAGVSVGTLDRAARAQGLCLAAVPDTDGETSVGSIAAVASTAGLGLCRAEPAELVTGVTLVTRDARVVRAGASHRLSGRPFMRLGAPDSLSAVLGSQGAAGVLTEVGFALEPAPFLAEVTLEDRDTGPERLRELLAEARAGIDRAHLDTFRVETSAEGTRTARRSTLVRAFSCESESEAVSRARDVAARLGAPSAPVDAQPDGVRRGLLPGIFTMPAGEHRRRLSGTALWGVEVAAERGAPLEVCLRILEELFGDLASLGAIHRRFGVYPGRHGVSAGVQVQCARGDASVAPIVERLRDATRPLLDAGAVPYRPGSLWAVALAGSAIRDRVDARGRESGDRA